MSGGIKKLSKETLYYGMSSIVGRFINWLLTPLYAYFLPGRSDFGVITQLYAWAAILLVILTYGMETGFFRFSNKEEEDEEKVYSTTMGSLTISSLLFVLISILFLPFIIRMLGKAEIRESYVLMFVFILAMDAFISIPYARLRLKNRPIKFAVLKLSFIFFNLLFNVFFIVLCPILQRKFPQFFYWYDISNCVFYIIFSNLISKLIEVLLLFSCMKRFRFKIDKNLLKKMLYYSLPLMILGVVGILNQNFDKIIFAKIYPDPNEAYTQLGIYGACFKIAVVMVMFIQAFRYAFEPFIFAQFRKNGEDRRSYADATKYFIFFTLFIFLTVMGYMDFLKNLIPVSYQGGLKVVPIVMMGMIFFGTYFNLSLWYKLIDRTYWGAIMSFVGFIIILFINIIFIPKYSYLASAWAIFFANLVMMLISYFLGQKHFPIPYALKSIFGSFCLCLLCYGGIILVKKYFSYEWTRLLINTGFILLYLFIIAFFERKKHNFIFIKSRSKGNNF